jgi:cation transport ATPase
MQGAASRNLGAARASKGQDFGKGTMDRTTLLRCDNLDCADCGLHVQHALERHSGVHEVTVDWVRHAVAVRHDESDAPAEALAAFVTMCGYPAQVAA